MQLNEASLMLLEAASFPLLWPHSPAIDSGSRPLQSPNQVLWFNFFRPIVARCHLRSVVISGD